MSMPKTTNFQAAKFLKAIAKPYDVFANAFKEGNSQKFYEEFHAAQNIWQNASTCVHRSSFVADSTRTATWVWRSKYSTHSAAS